MRHGLHIHYNDVKMSSMASQITGVSVVCSTVGSDADQRAHQSSASLAFMRGIHRWSVNSPHKRPVTREMFPLDDVVMQLAVLWLAYPKIYFAGEGCLSPAQKHRQVAMHYSLMRPRVFPFLRSLTVPVGSSNGTQITALMAHKLQL